MWDFAAGVLAVEEVSSVQMVLPDKKRSGTFVWFRILKHAKSPAEGLAAFARRPSKRWSMTEPTSFSAAFHGVSTQGWDALCMWKLAADAFFLCAFHATSGVSTPSFCRQNQRKTSPHGRFSKPHERTPTNLEIPHASLAQPPTHSRSPTLRPRPVLFATATRTCLVPPFSRRPAGLRATCKEIR